MEDRCRERPRDANGWEWFQDLCELTSVMWSEVRCSGAVDFTDVLCWSIRDGRSVLVVWYRLTQG